MSIYLDLGTRQTGIFMYDRGFCDGEETFGWNFSGVRNIFGRFRPLLPSLGTAGITLILIML